MDKRKFINESKHRHGADLNTKSKAKALRRRMTAAERILWKRLRMRQVKGEHIRRQHPYGMYILDFYCFKSGLVIELDGAIHRFSKSYDKERTEYLESTGLKVIRFKNEDVETRIDWVMETIERQL